MPENLTTVDQLLEQARFRQSFEALPKGGVFKDLSTIIIIPVPGVVEEKQKLVCECGKEHEYLRSSNSGMHPMFVDAWKRLIKPMNVPIVEMIISGHEVGVAYTKAVEAILATPSLAKFKYLLTVEYDNIIPYIPNTQGPLMLLYEDIEAGFDVAGGLYWTKGSPSMPLIYGDPKDAKDATSGMFKVRHDWNPGEVVECNGMGMGFTLFKLELFKDERLAKPWFKTVGEHTEQGPSQYTQDLYFFEKLRALNYRVCVDTRVKLGHLDFASGVIY